VLWSVPCRSWRSNADRRRISVTRSRAVPLLLQRRRRVVRGRCIGRFVVVVGDVRMATRASVLEGGVLPGHGIRVTTVAAARLARQARMATAAGPIAGGSVG